MQNQEAEVSGYLKRALSTAMANTMVNVQYSSVVKKITQNSYQVLVSFSGPVKEPVKQKVMANFYQYVKSNHPDLVGKVALTFTA